MEAFERRDEAEARILGQGMQAQLAARYHD
jgi:hypothetical protein